MKNNNFSVDIIIITRDRYLKLQRSIDRLISNTLKPHKIIIIDASNTIDITFVAKNKYKCKKYGIIFKHIKVPHFGVAYSRNIGLKNANSEYFAFIDDDIYVKRDWIYNVKNIFNKTENLVGVTGPVYITDKYNYWNQIWQNLLSESNKHEGVVDFIATCNACFKTQPIKKAKIYFDERLNVSCEDKAFSQTIIQKTGLNLFFSQKIGVYHDFRNSFIGFLKQWINFGYGGFLYNKFYFQKNDFPIFPKIFNVIYLPGIFTLNFGFLFGYLKSFLVDLSKSDNTSSKHKLVIFLSYDPFLTPPFYYFKTAKAIASKRPVIIINLPTNENTFRTLDSIKTFFKLIFFLFATHGLTWYQPHRKYYRFDMLLFHFYLKIYKFFNKSKIIIYTTSPKHDSIIDYIPLAFKIFECSDNPDNILLKNKSYLSKFNAVTSNYIELYNELLSINKNCYLVSSGFHNYSNIIRKNRIKNSVVFCGGISHRINFKWIYNATKSLPNTNFVFIGEKYLNKYYTDKGDNGCEIVWQKILNMNNVIWLEKDLSSSVLQEFLSMFTVGLIPYNTTDQYNKYSHPMKLYDYLAAGIPIISTNLPSMLNYRETIPIHFASNSKEFTNLIDIHSKKNNIWTPLTRNDVKIVLNSQSMETKLKQIENIISKII